MSSTTPRLEPRWPPVLETLKITSDRSSSESCFSSCIKVLNDVITNFLYLLYKHDRLLLKWNCNSHIYVCSFVPSQIDFSCELDSLWYPITVLAASVSDTHLFLKVMHKPHPAFSWPVSNQNKTQPFLSISLCFFGNLK